MAVMVCWLTAKKLITTIQVKLVQEETYSPELWLLNFQPLTYHHCHFLADFTIFSNCSYFKGAALLFTA